MNLRKLLAYLCIVTQSQLALAAGPTIWGPDSRALNLSAQGYTLQSGVTVDNDGVNNFIKASTAEASSQPALWSTYADAAQATPVNCTGGSPNVTWTRNTTTPLRGAADFKFTKDGSNRQGEGVAYAFTTGPSDGSGELLTISMPVKATEDAAYASGDLAVYVYDVTNTALLTPTIINVEDSAYQFTAQFNLSSSSSYRLCIHVASANASAYDVYFDDITVGLQKYDWPGQINLSNSPIDATGWIASGSGVTVATTTTSTDLPLSSPYASSAIKITPVSGTSDYARSRVTVPAALASTMLKAEWYQRPLSGYASGDLKFDVYSNSASDCSGSFTRLALTTDSSSVTSIPNATGKYTTYFTTDGSSVCYEVRFTRVAGTTALNITNFIFGPGIQPQGAVVGDPQSWTPTFVGLGTPTITEAKWTRIGTKMFGYVRATSGTATADVMTMTLPNSLTAQITTSGIVGEGWRDNASASTRKRVVLRAAASSNLLAFSNDDYTWDVSPISSSQVGSNLIGNTTVFTLQFIVEIAEWQGSGTVNLAQNNVEYAYTTGTWDADDSTTGYGPGGGSITGALSAARTKQITFQTPIQVTDQIELELSEDGTYWMPASSFANNAGNNFISTTWSAAASASTSSGFYITKGSTAYKANVIFMRYTWIANDDSPVGDWTNGWKFRLKKFTSGVPVGFGLVTDTSAGLMTNPSSLGDAAATMMGMKQYTTGVTYNNSTQITFSSTPAGWSVTHAYFIPYKVQDGSWRCRVNINASWTSTATPSVSINLEALSATQPAYASAATTAAYSYGFITRSGSQASTIEWRYGAAQTGGTWSADFVLNAKPTWAY